MKGVNPVMFKKWLLIVCVLAFCLSAAFAQGELPEPVTAEITAKVETGTVEAGETRIVTYTQRIDLQGGDYLISLGCTGYVGDTFTVYHRLYDALHVTVISDKNTVGFYDMNSKIEIKDL